MHVSFHIMSIILCCIIIWRASDGFEAAAEYIGRNLKDGVKGATINAIGSSMPELFTTFWFLFVLHNKDGFAGGIGTTAGSAIFNGMIIPAVVILAVIGYGLAKRITISKKVMWRDGLSLIIAELVLIFLIRGDTLDWWQGLVLMLLYVVYVVVMLTTMSSMGVEKEDIELEEEVKKTKDCETNNSMFWSMLTLDLEPIFIRGKINSTNAWTLLIFAMLIIGGSCALLVHACEGCATGMGVNTYFVAVILASAATSVPDTILSYRDAMNGEYDDAVANALGSNIFDICFALGFPLFVYTLIYGPITMSAESVENVGELTVILLFATIAAFLIFIIGNGLGRIKAILLLSIYLIFTLFIVSKASGAEWAIELGAFMRGLFPNLF